MAFPWHLRPDAVPDRPRAVVVVTGSELVRGDRHDLNGPFLAAELLRLGAEPARIIVVGDRERELETAVREGLQAPLCVLSGGLGPTHDDRTIELLAEALRLERDVDPALEQQIAEISRGFARRVGRPFEDYAPGVRKQATVPRGARVLGLAGTAPGVLVEHPGGVAIALPGPPSELRRLWPAAAADPAVRAILARSPERARRVFRLFGPGESTVARVLEEAGGEADGLEITICARDYEIHVDLFVEERGSVAAATVEEQLRQRFGGQLFAEDDCRVEELVLCACRTRGLTLGTGESCTGGMVAARLTDVPGASDVYLGGVIAYDNAVKVGQLGVPEALLDRHGAVSAECAEAMAKGVRAALGVDVAASVTGIAGPDGGTASKPVGLVFIHVETPDTREGIRIELPGDRARVRGRAAAHVLHHLRRLLTQSGHTPA